jgi:YidC/Oxa1 family membrane protein insertase
MAKEKRLIVFLVALVAWMWAAPLVLDRLGLMPKPVKPPVGGAAAQPDQLKVDKAPGAAQAAQPPVDPAPAAPVAAPAKATGVVLVPPDDLVVGDAFDKTPDGYRLEIRFSQRGAGVAAMRSSRYEAEFEEGKPRNRPLELILADPEVAPSFSYSVAFPTVNKDVPPAETPLDGVPWDVVRDANGRIVRPIQNGQEVHFRTKLGNPAVTLTKVYRLKKGQDGFELDLGFDSPDGESKLVYRMLGPHGIPIEGDWYTSTFRDVFFGRVGAKVDTFSAYDVVKRRNDPERYRSLPLKYAGIENQYFTVFLEPNPVPATREESVDDEAYATVMHEATDKQKSDVSVQLLSKLVKVGPNIPRTHSFRIFAGPKTAAALAPYDAKELSAYRKGWSLGPLGDLGASFVATNVIVPLLDRIYAVTAYMSRQFGGTRGNYGLAIILLTMTVRLILFPLGRKQAAMAKKMQDLQPHLAALKEKCGDDKEKMAKEQWALYREHKVNPMGGCLPALIQLPILIGLWQALNNSVVLRHSSFLWIRNLAAPDMLFKFPFPIPLFGQWLGPYFNLLPILVVGLMMFQTKLFSPPAVTEEAKMQQKTMKFMMIVMMFMFYKVPAGLSLYIMTSSMWQIGERLLLPKPAPKVAEPPVDPSEAKGGQGRGTPVAPNGRSRGPGPNANGKGRDWLADAKERVRQLMAEASKDQTYRKDRQEKDKDKDRPRPRPDRRKGRKPD